MIDDVGRFLFAASFAGLVLVGTSTVIYWVLLGGDFESYQPVRGNPGDSAALLSLPIVRRWRPIATFLAVAMIIGIVLQALG